MDRIVQVENLIITTKLDQFDIDLICREIESSYWAGDRPRELILISLEKSLCFSLFLKKQQIGFARVVTDYATFAYLCDVFVLSEHRGRGYGKYLIESVMDHNTLKTVSWLLRTKDAHGLYKQFGFTKTHRPERYMEKNCHTMPHPQEKRRRIRSKSSLSVL